MRGRIPAVAVIAVALAFGSAGPAAADANSQSSCIGIEASSISPPGSSDEFPGGMRELQAFLRDAFGSQTGAVVSELAHLHLGSHEACDAAS
jgi:hypothetical protein